MNMTSNRMNVDVKVQAVAGHGVSSSSQSVLAAAPVNPSIRIKLKSYWVDLLQDTVDKITDVAVNTGATIAGPVPLPTRCGDYWWSVAGCGLVGSQPEVLLKSGGLGVGIVAIRSIKSFIRIMVQFLLGGDLISMSEKETEYPLSFSHPV
jgi:hypothetical protein